MSVGKLLIVEDNRPFAADLMRDAVRIGLDVRVAHNAAAAEDEIISWKPTIIAMDLVMPDSDGLELLRTCGHLKYPGKIVLMSGGFELYLEMAAELARSHNLHVAGKLTKPFRPNQFSYLLMSLI